MKQLKLSVLLIVLLSISFGLKAQDKFGIRGGFQTGNIYNSGSLYDKNLNTFYVGVFKEFKVVPLIKFDAGIDFNQNGSLNDSMSVKLSYISIPLNAKIKIGPIYGLVGAAPAFKVAEKWELNDQTVDIDKFKSNFFDVPVFVGVGFKVAIISIEARYYIGTMSINDNAISGLQDYKSQYLQLGLALSI
jgi:hypothetical protein